MMGRRLRGIVLLAAVFPFSANAIPILSATGELAGFTGVDVGGTLYDVTFDDRNFYDVFGLSPVLDASTRAEAEAFSQALLDQVLLDGALGNFDSNPNSTLGCNTTTNVCVITTPFSYSQPYAYSIGAFNSSNNLVDAITTGQPITSLVGNPTLGGSGPGGGSVWARWTVSPVSVPEPGTLSLLSIGLVSLAALRRKRGT